MGHGQLQLAAYQKNLKTRFADELLESRRLPLRELSPVPGRHIEGETGPSGFVTGPATAADEQSSGAVRARLIYRR